MLEQDYFSFLHLVIGVMKSTPDIRARLKLRESV